MVEQEESVVFGTGPLPSPVWRAWNRRLRIHARAGQERGSCSVRLERRPRRALPRPTANGNWTKVSDVALSRPIGERAVRGVPSGEFVPADQPETSLATAARRGRSRCACPPPRKLVNVGKTSRANTDLGLDLQGRANLYLTTVRTLHGPHPTSACPSANRADGATVCILDLCHHHLIAPPRRDYFRATNMKLRACPRSPTNAEGSARSIPRRRPATSTRHRHVVRLAATRATFENADEHVILPEIVSKRGRSARSCVTVTNEWGDIVFWTLTGLPSCRRGIRRDLGQRGPNWAAAPTRHTRRLNRMLGHPSGDFSAPR